VAGEGVVLEEAQGVERAVALLAECGEEEEPRPAVVKPGMSVPSPMEYAGEADVVSSVVRIDTRVSALGHFDDSPRANSGWAVRSKRPAFLPCPPTVLSPTDIRAGDRRTSSLL